MNVAAASILSPKFAVLNCHFKGRTVAVIRRLHSQSRYREAGLFASGRGWLTPINIAKEVIPELSCLYKCPPAGSRREGITVTSNPRKRSGYCLSYTAMLLNFLPSASVPLVVTVRVLPSADSTIRPVTVTFPSFLIVRASVRSLTRL